MDKAAITPAAKPKYILVEPGIYVYVDTDKKQSKIYVKSDIEMNLAEAQARLAELPVIDDAYLLAWAREHFDQMDAVREREYLERLIVELQALLRELK